MMADFPPYSHARTEADMSTAAIDFPKVIGQEISSFLAAQDKREYTITRCERLFDEVVEPVDLPGPDRAIDPLLRAAIRPIVGRVFDAARERLEAVNAKPQ